MGCVKKLFTSLYDDAGQSHQDIVIANPTWEEISGLIRTLDRFQRPYVWFYLDPNAGEDCLPEFEILGGDGVFLMAGHDVNSESVFYFNAEDDDRLIDVWTSDQGARFPSKVVCFNVDVVEQATKYFFDNGVLDPSLQWRPLHSSG